MKLPNFQENLLMLVHLDMKKVGRYMNIIIVNLLVLIPSMEQQRSTKTFWMIMVIQRVTELLQKPTLRLTNIIKENRQFLTFTEVLELMLTTKNLVLELTSHTILVDMAVMSPT